MSPYLSILRMDRTAVAPSSDLVQPADLTFLGSFKLPHGAATTLNGGGKVIAISDHHTMFVAGHEYTSGALEITIPTPKISGTLGGLNSAAILQPVADIYGGHYADAGYSGGAGNVITGGLLTRDDGKLIVCNYVYYDAGYQSQLSHFLTDQTFSNITPGNVVGPIGINASNVPYVPGCGGFTSNFMCHIPTEWQAALGGTAIATGQGLSVSGRTSGGPAATVFNIEDLGVLSPLPAMRLLGYPSNHPTMEDLNLWNYGGGDMAGCCIIPGTRTLLYFGTHGTGGAQFTVNSTFEHYGTGTSNGSLAGGGSGANLAGTIKSQSGSSIDWWIYDPAQSNKGYHSFPYESEIWAYDLLDLVDVKNGLKETWDVLPYAQWAITLPFQTIGKRLYGATYEPETRSIYVSSQSTDGGYPTIHMFQLPDYT